MNLDFYRVSIVEKVAPLPRITGALLAMLKNPRRASEWGSAYLITSLCGGRCKRSFGKSCADQADEVSRVISNP